MNLNSYNDELLKIAEEESKTSDRIFDRYLPGIGAVGMGTYGAAKTDAFVPDKIFPGMSKLDPKGGRARLVSGLFGASAGASLMSLPGTIRKALHLDSLGKKKEKRASEAERAAWKQGLNYLGGGALLTVSGGGGIYAGRKLKQKHDRDDEQRRKRRALREALSRSKSSSPWKSDDIKSGGTKSDADVPAVSMNSQYDTTWDTASAGS